MFLVVKMRAKVVPNFEEKTHAMNGVLIEHLVDADLFGVGVACFDQKLDHLQIALLASEKQHRTAVFHTTDQLLAFGTRQFLQLALQNVGQFVFRRAMSQFLVDLIQQEILEVVVVQILQYPVTVRVVEVLNETEHSKLRRGRERRALASEDGVGLKPINADKCSSREEK